MGRAGGRATSCGRGRAKARSVCLITPPSAFLLDERVFVSLGILKVAASLEAQDYRVNFLDLSGVENYLAPLEDYLTVCQDAAIGITTTTPQLPSVMRIAETIRRLRPDLKLILGGPHVTLVYSAKKLEAKRGIANGRGHRSAAQLEAAFDVLCSGDGELAIFEALKDDAPKVVDGDDPKGGLFLTDKMFTEGADAGAASGRPEIVPLQHRGPSRDQPDRAARLSVRLRLLRRAQQQEPAPNMRPTVRDLFGSRIELRLGDPIDTMVNRASALKVPEAAPGRGITADGHQLLVALPRIDGQSSVTDLPDRVSSLVDAVAGGWVHDAAPSVRMLPSRLPYETLPPADEASSFRVTFGISESDLGPVAAEFGSESHLILLGEPDSGKTAFLRVLARRIVQNNSPDEARIVIVDHRRSLLGEVTSEHLVGYGTDLASTTSLMADAASAMRARLPGPDVTPEQLRARSWWQGPELYVLVDDYDLASTSMNNPFLPLMEYLAQGRDIGLHVVVTRRTGGAGRALFEQFFARLRDVGAAGVMLSGDRDEGPLLGGIRPEKLPPGRGRLISRRGGAQLVQVAWVDPAG